MFEIEKKIIEKIKEEVKKIFEKDSSGHDWHHTYRVYKNSIKIANEEKISCNFFILEITALLHDIADHKFGYSDNDRVNIITALLIAEKIDVVTIDKIIENINNISFSKGNIPSSIEGKIVQDADRIDALGAIGIARTFAFGGHKGRSIYSPESNDRLDSISHFYDKLLLLKNNLNTESAKKIAVEREQFMKLFLSEFYKEWNCK